MRFEIDLRERRQDLRVENGHRVLAIEPTEFIAVRLVSELADAWMDMTVALDLSWGTRWHYLTAMRNLAAFLTTPDDRRLTLTKGTQQLLERFYQWECELQTVYPPTSDVPRRLGERLRRLTRWYLELHQVASPMLSRWAASTPLSGSARKTNPLDEFSNAERRMLERACRDIILTTEERIRRGRALLKDGDDPRTHGWDGLANLVWAVCHLPHSPEAASSFAAAWTSTNSEIVEYLGTMDVVPRHRGNRAHRRIAALLFPDTSYLMAIRVLLHLRTGLSPEETKLMSLDDVRFEGGQVSLRAIKRRAARTRWIVLDTNTSAPWGWKAGDLLNRANSAMALSRAQSQPGEKAFWITPKRIGSGPLDLRQEVFSQYGFGDLIREAMLDISGPPDLRRLRKTVKSAKAALLGTMAGGAGNDHSIEVFRNHYAQSTTVHVIAARTVTNAQTDVFERAVQGPVLIAAPAADLVENSESTLAAIAANVASESTVEQSMTTTACKSPFDSPFMASGELCHASPSLCLQCPNAVVFADHVPRLLAYRTVLQGLQDSMTPTAFTEVHGQQKANLDLIISKFPAIEGEPAMQRNELVELHLPLAQRVTLS